jgi:hypothetical protein
VLEVHIRVGCVGYLVVVGVGERYGCVSVNRVIFVVYTINVQRGSFYSGLCNKRGWGYGFVIGVPGGK